MSRETLLVVDGNSLAHRAFHAIPLLSNSEGIITNAAYGFTNMLFKVLKERGPELVAVAFDKGKITFRHSTYADYKLHRKATPDELRGQFPLLKEILRAMQIPVFEVANYEADDLIGAITALAEKKGLNCLVLTGDMDALQLVSPHTRVLLTKKGISEVEEYDVEAVSKRFGVPPERLVDYKGLVGDPSDNIPGVPGIGPKTAGKLLGQFETLEELLDKLDEVPPRWRNKLEEYREQALMSKQLATIEREVPQEIDIASCRWPGPDYQRLLQIFSNLEFKSLIKNIVEEAGEKQAQGKRGTAGKKKDKADKRGLDIYSAPCRVVEEPGEINELAGKAKSAGKIALTVEGDKEEDIKSLALTLAPGENYYLPVPGGKVPEAVGSVLADPPVAKYCHNAKRIIRLLHPRGIPLAGLSFDTMVAAYLLNPGSTRLELSDLALQYLNIVLPPEEEKDMAAAAESIFRLKGHLQKRLRENELEKLYYDVELPLIYVLAKMETNGVAVDVGQLREMSRDLSRQIDEIAGEIYALAGEEFNINSPRQLGVILFEKLGLPVIKKTKTGYSTDAGVLEELAGSHPIIEKIIAHRQLVKLKTTYVDGLAQLINPKTGRLHTTFHQTVTATGRLSSAEPNLQNIPIRLEQGRKIRKVFVPRKPGNFILTADYSQIELRVLAHMSGDAVLQEAFSRGQDIHARTAAEVFGVGLDEVTSEMRNRAKAVNFGIIYGMSEFGLSRDIKVSRAEAKRYIENYFARYRGVRQYIQQTIAEARRKGYVTTILNRRRYLPDLFSPNRNVRNFGERTAVNTPIQGSAADIIKLAMVNIQQELDDLELEARMILQVHDELIFDVPGEELPILQKLVRDRMENAISLNVPLVVDLKAGPNWYDVKKL